MGVPVCVVVPARQLVARGAEARYLDKRVHVSGQIIKDIACGVSNHQDTSGDWTALS